MKLRNKKTGEIGSLKPYGGEDGRIWVWIDRLSRPEYRYNSLAELNKEWEDYEEPKGKALYWMILTLENFIENEPDDKWVDLEDCKQMLKKLKAWERLKDKGFSFNGWTIDDGLKISICTNFDSDGIYDDDKKEIKSDLDICFGGEE